MGFAFITWLKALLRRLLGRDTATGEASKATCATGLHTAAGRGFVAWPSAAASHASRPLRVLRIVDAGHAPSTAGRMVISGRLADVCAELDRLVAAEAAAA